MTNKKNLLITGGTGFIGTALQKTLVSCHDYQVYLLIRSNRTPAKTPSPPHTVTYITLKEIEIQRLYFESIINLAGENIASKRWSKKRKVELYESRIILTNALEKSLFKKPKEFISMSAVGIYGDKNNKVYNENTMGAEGFPYDLCKAWEQSANNFLSHGTRVCIIRLGVVLGNGGALKKIIPAFKFGLGGKIGSGEQYFPWVHITDVINLILYILKENKLHGIFNAVAPQHIQQKEFAESLAAILKRPCLLTTPKWLLSCIFGEMATLLVNGVQVEPVRTIKAGFEFKYTKIKDALNDTLLK